MPDKKEEKKVETPEQKKEEIAKTYGIDLSQIQHIKIDNGRKDFLKFVDPQDKSVKLVELINSGINAQANFENRQKELNLAHGDDEKANAKEILEHDMKYKYNVVNLTPMHEFKSNKFKYMRMLDNMETIKKKKIKAILKGSKKYNIKLTSISFDYAIGIDENGTAIQADYDFVNNKAVVKGAELVDSKDKDINLEDDISSLDISSEELNGVFENITITSDGPMLVNDKKVSIKGTEINTKTVVDLYNMPELMDKMTFNTKQKSIYRFILGAIIRKIGAKTNEANEVVKERVLEKHTNNSIEDKAA